MSAIVELPVLYTVRGTLRGRRKPAVVRVIETLPFQVQDHHGSGSVVEMGKASFLVSDGRPWAPLRGIRRFGMTPDETTEAARSYATAKTADPDNTDDYDGITLGVGRPWREVAEQVQHLSIPPGADWRLQFSSVHATDRTSSIETSRCVAERLRTIEGRVHSDRLEPLVSYHDPGRTDTIFNAFDVVLQVDRYPFASANGGLWGKGFAIRQVKASGSHPWGLPEGPSWARDILWETDVTQLPPLSLARQMQATMLRSAEAPQIRSAIGHRAAAALVGLSEWDLARQDGSADPLSVDEFSSILRVAREGVEKADLLVVADDVVELGEVLDKAEEHMTTLLERSRPRIDLAHEDVDALRIPFGP